MRETIIASLAHIIETDFKIPVYWGRGGCVKLSRLPNFHNEYVYIDVDDGDWVITAYNTVGVEMRFVTESLELADPASLSKVLQAVRHYKTKFQIPELQETANGIQY